MFHMHFTQILHTISICLTVTLAVWRYIAIMLVKMYFIYLYSLSNLLFLHRHPHGTFSSFALSHCAEAILLSFIVAPILCFPTYFVFRIQQTSVVENNHTILLYHLDDKEDTAVYR